MGYDKDAVDRHVAAMREDGFPFTEDQTASVAEGGLRSGQHRVSVGPVEVAVMTEEQVVRFVTDMVFAAGGDPFMVAPIVARWMEDRQAAVDQARDFIHDELRDGWQGE